MWIGKTYEIAAAHYIPDHPKCGHMHGHNYQITVMVEGKINYDGFVMDFGDLNKIVVNIINPMDHNLLNEIIPVPTCEYLAQFICKELSYKVPEYIREVKIKVQEGPRGGWAECHNITM